MKKSKIITIGIGILALIVIIGSIIGCQGETTATTSSVVESEVPTTDEPLAEVEVTSEIAEADSNTELDITSSDITIEEQVLFDQDNVKLTILSMDTSSLFGTDLNVLIENNSDQNVTVQVRDMSINGLMIDSPLFSSDIASGKKSNDSISILLSELEINNITTISDIELSFLVFNSETWEDIFQTDIITVKTSAYGTVTQAHLESGEEIVNQSEVIVHFTGFTTDSIFGPVVNFHIINNSDTDITVQARDVSVDGFMIDGMMSADVMAGKSTNTTLTFFDSTLQENGIDTLNNVELKLNVFNKDTWDDIFTTEIITLAK